MAMNSHNPSFLIPSPLPDEVLYSRLVRFSLLNGLSKSQVFNLIFGKRKIVFNIQLPSHIKKLSDFGFGSNRDLILTQTLFLYFSNLVPYQRKKLYRSMCKDKGSDTTKISLLANIKCNQNYHLKYCPYCYHEDIEEHGVAYWHLSHQIPYQVLCPKHFIELENVNPRAFKLPKSKTNNRNIQKCNLELKPIGQLMLHTSKLLNNLKPIIISQTDISNKLKRLGYKTKKGRYKRKAIMNEVLNYYKKSIQYLPFTSHSLTRPDFFDSIFHSSRRQKSFSPIKLLLLDTWIENFKQQHITKKSRKNKKVKSLNKNKPIKVTKLDSKIILRGITGENRYSIASFFNISVYRVEKSLSLYKEVIMIRKAIWRSQRRIKYRFKVLNYLMSTSSPSIKELKFTLNKEYYWLYLYDKKWLYSHQPEKDNSTIFS